LAWVTDIHLNFLKGRQIQESCRTVKEQRPDAVLIGGDNAEAPTLSAYLTTLENELPCPIYCVLGNHDFYRGSIRGVRTEVEAPTRRSRRLVWLPSAGVVPLTETAALIGHDGWADGRLGDFDCSTVMLQKLTVLCGHTHGAGVAQILPNLVVKTGGATYADPSSRRCWYYRSTIEVLPSACRFSSRSRSGHSASSRGRRMRWPRWSSSTRLAGSVGCERRLSSTTSW
jgi:predicted phosphodiesterase